MALIYLQKGFAALLILALLFNMSQRKHLEKGERKRYASLLFAVAVFMGFVGIITIRRFAFPAVSLAAVAGIMILLLVSFRKRIFIFKLSCGACGTRFPIRQILYVDDPACPVCSARVSEDAAAGSPAAPGTSESPGTFAAKGSPSLGTTAVEGTPGRAALGTAEAPRMAAAGSLAAVVTPTAAGAPATGGLPTAPLRVTATTKVADIDWPAWKYTEEAVLCYIVTGGQVLLMRKKTGLGTGKINAPGGRIEKGETPEQAAVRETIEEVGLTPYMLEKRMDLHFLFTNGYSLRGYVFFADSCTGAMIETREADPFWCSVDAIPFDRMWADDSVWLGRAMSGEKLEGFFVFDDDTMLDALVVPASGDSGGANNGGHGPDVPAGGNGGSRAGKDR